MSAESLKNNEKAKKLCVSLVPIFNHLDYDEQLEVARTSRSKTYGKKDVIFQAGDPSEYLYIVHTGKVKIYNLSESGKEQLIRILEPGEFMGELAVFTDEWLTSFAEAVEPTEICAIHKSDLQEFLKEKPAISFKLLAESSKRLKDAEKTIERLSSQDVEKRLSSYLLEQLEKTDSSKIKLPMSKKDLASYLGTTQETLSRRLASFEEKSLLAQTGQRKIDILDAEGLEAIAE
ncbi:CRP/FNR family transcriptional regulator, anaerobic regulatory protein [Lentibacillus persicus]|uniref:CRP/FNR family transcriptional regulator, anaerobic regulatory protein n=1 Tax=Lentibacillus persicus TaxID=640948 RepID=A0A1I1YDX2_9BACI|nr:Crp/Fnr family transcriptional regulator [Lentibacillus persicus]SFE17766.1 CRP/FNR family transcriptional regulator, anaerobic regulatory protein [Lentibacillus persicus]